MHVLLSDYSAIPLVVALAVAQLSESPWLRVLGPSGRRWRLIGAIVIVVWAGGTGTYYAVLSAILLVITSVIAIVRSTLIPIIRLMPWSCSHAR